MHFWTQVVGVLLTVPLFSTTYAQDCTVCESFGTDFQNGGSYFQNILSSANFTAHEEFQGCQNDSADNILVDPDGNQYLCSTSPMTPSDTSELFTCPIEEKQMYSGNWTIIVISNNGDCDPIDYMREFYVSVGTQMTVTTTPVVSETTTSTANAFTVSTATQSTTITGPPVETTVANTGVTVFTVTPFPSILYTHVPAFTITVTETLTSVVPSTQTLCATTAKPVADVPNLDIVVTVLADVVAPLETIVGGLLDDVGDILRPRDLPFAYPPPAALAHRAVPPAQPNPLPRLPAQQQSSQPHPPLLKRTPESPTVTVTASTYTSVVATTTTTSTYTAIVTTQLTSTITPTVTVQGNTPVTVSTAPQNTDTVTIYDILSVASVSTTITSWSTSVLSSTVTC